MNRHSGRGRAGVVDSFDMGDAYHCLATEAVSTSWRLGPQSQESNQHQIFVYISDQYDIILLSTKEQTNEQPKF